MKNKKEKRTKRHQRIRQKVKGTHLRPRLSIFRSNKHIYAQIIDDFEGKTLAAVSDKKLENKSKIEKAKEIGLGLGKARDVASAIRKAVGFAKKNLITVPIVNGTIPHDILIKRGAAKVLLKPAPEGTGVIAGGAVRVVVEAVGIRNISSKILGTRNPASNIYATLEALSKLVK